MLFYSPYFALRLRQANFCAVHFCEVGLYFTCPKAEGVQLFPTLAMFLSPVLHTPYSCYGGNSRSSGLSISPQRESCHWQLLDFWVSAFTLILSIVDSFLLCHLNNAIKDLFSSSFNILVIFIGRIFQDIWSIIVLETSWLQQPVKRQESNQLCGLRGQEKNNSQLFWRDTTMFGTKARPGFFSVAIPASTMVFLVSWMARYAQAAAPTGFRTYVLQSAKAVWCLVVKKIQKDRLLFLFCVIHNQMGLKLMQLQQEASESSYLYFQFLRHAQTGWNLLQLRHGR